ncbi:MAG: hypothetical protein V4795_22455 [Pseudomonadota bacterium]
MQYKANILSLIASLVITTSAFAQTPFNLGDNWKGEYICGQGKTPASLRIRKVTTLDSKVVLQGVFDFGGGQRPRGAYLVAGQYDPTENKLSLTPTGWLLRPGQYIAVGFTGQLANGNTTLVGSVDHATCGEFSFQRDGDQRPLDRQNQPDAPAGGQTVAAQAGAQRLQQARDSYCMQCHDMHKRILGPSLMEIATKYANNPAAVGELTNKVLHGSVGNWGRSPQPAMTDPRFIGRPLTEPEVRVLVEWILSLR